MKTTRKPLAKYVKIMQEVVKAIRHGDLGPGGRIPSENELIEKYKVSNTTARRVLDELERAGWVTRIKGRGTFGHGRYVDRSVDRILGFTKNMVEAGRVPSTRLLSVKLRPRGRTLVIDSHRYILAGPVCEIKRLRLADEVPMMVETRYVSETICPGIHKKKLEGSLYDIYEQDYGLQLMQINQRLLAITVEGEKVGFPDVQGLIPAFFVEGVTLCAEGLILEMEESIYRGDMYHFSVRATR